MNLSELAAKLAPLVGLNLARWVDWTPTVTQGAAVTVTAYYSVGHFVAYDAAPSALFYAGVLRSNNNASALIMNTDGGTGALGINPAWTVANGDSLNISGTYRVA